MLLILYYYSINIIGSISKKKEGFPNFNQHILSFFVIKKIIF